MASNFGRIKSVARYVAHKKFKCKFVPEKLRSPVLRKNGYFQIPLWFSNNVKYEYVHRLVYEAFKGPIFKKMQINHKNFIRSDNRPENLEIMTAAENLNYSRKAGRYKKSSCVK